MADDGNDNPISYTSSSFSGGGNCVEVGFSVTGAVHVRDSSEPGPALNFTAAEWDAFVAGVRNGEFDRPTG